MSLRTLYDEASLWMTPSGYEDGKLFSELPTDGSGDFTFSRGSNLAATRVGPTGLIEKGRENLIPQSNQFDTTWATIDSNVTSGQSGYDGSSNAWELDAPTAGGRLYQSISFSGVHTFSIYAKKGTANGIRVRLQQTSVANAYIDLRDGSLFSSSSDIDVGIQDVSNGWYRITFALNASGVSLILLYPTDGEVSQTTGSIYIQDAQLEIGLAATDYIESGATTGKAGLLENEPRLDYSGGATCPSLLLEPQRTNLFDNSEYIEGWSTSNTGATIEENAATSPEGVVNAAKIKEDATNAAHAVRQLTGPTLTSGTDYTFSFFAKKGERSIVALSNTIGASNDANCFFDLENGQVLTNQFNSASIEDFGNGWYRCIATDTADAADDYDTRIYTATADNQFSHQGVSGNGLYIYGLQLEQGSYKTSYIPTYGSSVTRSVDTFKVTGISDLIDTQGGVMLLETKALDRNQGYSGVSLSDDTFTNNAQIRYGSATDQVQIQYRVGSSNECLASNSENDITNNLKIAFKYESNSFKMFVNGVLKGTDTSGLVNAANTFDTIKSDRGDGNDKYLGRIKQLVVFPTALTDSECIKLTTI